MIKNFFLVAWRNLWRNKGFSLTNIAGLSIGMTCTLLIFLWVYNERSWDRSQKHYDRIYHIYANRDFNGTINTGPDMMYPLAKALKESYPEVEQSAIASFEDTRLLSVGDKRVNRNVITVSPDFFEVFSYDAIAGNPSAAAKDPDALIVTESTAKILFGTTNVLNKEVEVKNSRMAVIKAVLKDLPANSTVQFEALLPFNPSAPNIQRAENDWVNCGNRVFIKTTADANIPALQTKIMDLIRQRSEGDNPTTKGSVILHPMKKWRLFGEFRDGINVGGRIEYVNLFSWIAVIILLIACVNFMNLSTSRSEKRAKEVGIRKTLGSERKQLLAQFITESIFLSVIAFVISALAVWFILPSFESLLNQKIEIPYNNLYTWLCALAVVLVTGIIAGSYPAVYLSGFNPVKVLKGSFMPGRKGLLPRKILVTGQFIVSVVLLSATLIIFKQLQYVKNRNAGYNKNNLVMVNSSPDADRSYDALKNDLLQSGMVKAVNRTSNPITNIFMSTSGIDWDGAPKSNNLVIGFLFAHDDFAKTLQVKINEGRDFRRGDTNTVLFNQAAIKTMGIENPVGKTIRWAGRERKIIGIIDDMIMTSPYAPADPLMVCYENNWSSRMNLRLAEKTDTRKALARIEEIFKKYSIEYPFEYRFVDEEYGQKFNNEQLIGRLSLIFAGLAIFICCLGLFGLVSSAMERRKKEIGIRKVLGASVRGLLLLMSKDFLVLVAIAFGIAIPAAWWAMNNWLQNFNYRIDIGIGMFVIVGLILLAVTFITVALNAAKAAMNKPVKSLRSE